MSRHVILTGATGMVGREALKACLASDQVSKLTSLTRRLSGVRHKKLSEIIVSDFLDYSGPICQTWFKSPFPLNQRIFCRVLFLTI